MSQAKMLFRLDRDDEGYPPVDIERLWCEEIGAGEFTLDNIPFFTRQATLGDVVEGQRLGDEIFYLSTLERSQNSLLRVVFFDGRDPSALRAELAKLGCSSEQSHLQSLIAVNVPPSVNIADVRNLLNEGCEKGFWDYEEPILRQ
jgi:Domain of unknown function (DUF4265)